MSTSSVEIVKSVYQGFQIRDPAAMFTFVSPEVEIVQSNTLPWGGVYRGHEGALHFFGKLTSRIDSNVELERLIDAGDLAAIGWTAGKVVATGTPFRVPFVHVWTIRGGLVTRVRFLIENSAMLAALAE